MVTAKAEVKDAPYVLATVGTIKAAVSVNIKSRFAANIKKVHFVEGSLVKAGQVLYTIDPAVNALTEQQAGATYQRDRADYEQLERDLGRYKALSDQGVISREQYEEKHTATVRAKNAMRASGAGASIARQTLSYNTITSPIDGRIGATLFNEGSFVKDKDDILAVVNTTTPLEVSFSLPERYLAELRRQYTQGTLTVEAAPPGMEAHPEIGQLTFMDNQVETGTGAIRLKARFENPEGRLWPGQFVTVGLVLKTIKNAVLVPSSTIQNGPEGTFVFVVKDGHAEMRPVRVSVRVHDSIIVEKGLSGDEVVVTEGHLRLFPGAAVMEAEAKGGASGKGAKPTAEPAPAARTGNTTGNTTDEETGQAAGQ
ncbi:MAG: efflux RND transporter periplasmic adaptor subunit, partial [Humidesulfovibrio sp.]|nr:efflux RND transporter periplasmic adaptor subunit [Humidesulfovibrio sp.]